ncbi:cytochrome P450 [Mycena epipterygia]|nr:cytochrome P450 [Mycena epipterygia]
MSNLLETSVKYAAEHNLSTASALISILAVYVVFSQTRRRSTIGNLPGPPSPSWLFGHTLQLLLPRTYGDYEFEWQKLYGPVYRLRGCFGQERLMISDPVSLQYILNSPHFAFGPLMENLVHLLHGKESIMGVKEEDHKRLRAALSIGFTAAAVRNYRPSFLKAAQTATEEFESSPHVSVNVGPVLGNATLGAISEAVLGYSTKDLGEEFLLNNFRIGALASAQSPTRIISDAIGMRLPSWVWSVAIHLPIQPFATVTRVKALADQIGSRVIQNKREAARQGLEIDTDLYGQLLDVEHSKNALTENEIIAQTSIILAAGQDTTTNTMSFALLELAKNTTLQDELRAEIHSIVGAAGADHVPYDSMPLLNAFMKEVLRMYPAEAISERISLQDTVIPRVTTSTGETVSEIRIRKGQVVLLGLSSYQRLESRWGEDAHEFKPSRWLHGTPYQGEAIGPYANLLSFLGGPRTCPGWRFAILEMQVFICELVGKFSFALPKDGSTRARFATTLQPMMSDGEKGVILCVKRIV